MKVTNYQDNPQIQRHRWWILTAVGLFTFMSVLDGSIVNIALPVMSRDLHIPMNQAEWVVSCYLIVVCALLLLFGKIGDIAGKIRVFRLGTALFVLGSFGSGFGHSFYLLLVARVIQATGAAMTMSTNNGIITEIFPASERGRALGTIGSFVSLGAIAGPGIGGLILAQLPWGYIFWINVPVGILTMILGHFVLPKDIRTSHEKIDRLGATTFGVGIVLLFLGVFMGQEVGFLSPWVLGSFIIAIGFFTLFGHTERRVTAPLIDFDIFKNRQFTISVTTAFLIFISNFFFNVISPFYLENARHLPPNLAGYTLMVFPFVQVLVAPLAGTIADRTGSERLTLVGLAIIALSQIGYMLTSLQTPLWLFMIYIAGVGLGNGIFQAPNNSMVMSSVQPRQLGIAGGINALARNMGMVVGISVATTVLFSAMSHTVGHHVTSYLTGQPQVFIEGMHVSFMVSLAICLIATGLTLWHRTTAATATDGANRD